MVKIKRKEYEVSCLVYVKDTGKVNQVILTFPVTKHKFQNCFDKKLNENEYKALEVNAIELVEVQYTIPDSVLNETDLIDKTILTRKELEVENYVI